VKDRRDARGTASIRRLSLTPTTWGLVEIKWPDALRRKGARLVPACSKLFPAGTAKTEHNSTAQQGITKPLHRYLT
jgi:hypothetical protein